MDEPGPIVCEVAYGRPDCQFVFTVELTPGSTARDALIRALDLGLADRCPEIRADQAVLGVFGKIVGFDHRLQPGDRVEIYRPLATDPRAARRARARTARR